MCQFASGFFKPDTMEVKIADLNSHSETARILGLIDDETPNAWREFHYVPTGEIQCRTLPQDQHSRRECEDAVRARWPRFVEFLNWCFGEDSYIGGSLDLRGCDLKGVKLPESIGGWLDLHGCDLTGVKLPKSIRGEIDLSGCDLTGVNLPKSIGGWLYLSGCDLKGVKLPESIGGSLDLHGCDLTGVKIPERFYGQTVR